MPTNDEFDVDTDEEFIEDHGLVVVLFIFCEFFNRFRFGESIPKRTSVLTGRAYVAEVLNGHPEVLYEQFRMHKPIFLLLCDNLVIFGGLKDSRYLTVHEQVMIFLFIVGQNTRNRVCQDRFQHSGHTISFYFNKVLKACCKLGKMLIAPPDFNEVPQRIANDPRFDPFFKDCVGAIDGTHIKTVIPQNNQVPYRGHKTITTQNVLAICAFDMRFTYVVSGWEGTANDSRVLNECLSNPSMQFPMPPEGKYYLGDSGYQNMPGFIVPYKGVRDYEVVDPDQLEEWYNYRHSSLRNVIERCFGSLKKRFPILREMPIGLSVKAQKYIPLACCAIHNFILRFNQEDPILVQYRYHNADGDPNWVEPEEPSPQGGGSLLDLTPASLTRASKQQDKIARGIYRDAIRHGWQR